MKYCYQGDMDFDFLYCFFCVVGERVYGCRLIKKKNVYCFLVECQKEFDWVYYLDIG